MATGFIISIANLLAMPDAILGGQFSGGIAFWGHSVFFYAHGSVEQKWLVFSGR